MGTRLIARRDRPGARVYFVVAAALVGLAIAYWLWPSGIQVDSVAVRTWLVDLGPIAPLAYIAIYALQVIVAPVPGLPIGAAAGYVFGLAPALLYGLTGLGMGASIALLAGRHWGLRLLARVAGPEMVAKWGQLRLINSPITWLVIFLGPSPDLILFVAGMTRIPLARLFLIAVVGRAPAMVAATLLGAGAADMGPWLIVGATAIGIVACGGGFLFKRFAPEVARS